MKRNNLARLLADVVSSRIDPDATAEMDPDMMADVVLGRRRLAPADVDKLWSSPLLQREFLETRRTVMARCRAQWGNRGFDAPAMLRAAASEADVQTVKGLGWSVEIVRLSQDEWAISVTLSAEARAELPDMAKIQVSDDGGLIWGIGKLDDTGALDLEWQLAQSPLERLLDHQVSVVPV